LLKNAAAPAFDRHDKTMPMLEINGLTKRYGRHTVVDNLSFSCSAGEVLGFLGPNGAGKSTTMKMVTGFVQPSAGRAVVCGHDIGTDTLAAQRCLGYLPEGAPLYAEMTPGQFLEFIADIRQLEGNTRRERIDEVIERLHLGPVLRQSIDTLSKGFKRRVGLAQAIMHDPDVLILDEPTDGLDPNQKQEVRELIRSMSADKLIVISTHILEEVEAVCSRAIIIADGKLLVDDTPENLMQRGGGRLDEVFRRITQGGEL
jgi:ABC-2 type transport system ATP-binding protein